LKSVCCLTFAGNKHSLKNVILHNLVLKKPSLPRIILILIFSGIVSIASAQSSELGGWLGTANYFGDLNTETSFRFVHPAGGIFYRYDFNNRFSFRINGIYARVSADDKYSKNVWERVRNLNFYSDIFEGSAQFEFNFLPLVPNKRDKFFTPYITTGFGGFYFNPKTIYKGQVVQLQPLHTEGEGLPEYPDVPNYSLISSAWLVGGGVKFLLTPNWMLQIEAVNRKTLTDYLDDVSGQYADPTILLHEVNATSAALSNRSGVISSTIGEPGSQRGDPANNDKYLLIGIGISYIFTPYKCPPPSH
jgi:opacity protein-like surface antigen